MMPKRFTQGALAPALRPVLAWLAAGTLAAVLSALALLAALWALVQFVADLGIGWVITALGLWVVGASMASLASWLSHRAEAGFCGAVAPAARQPSGAVACQHAGPTRQRCAAAFGIDDIAALHHMTAHLPSEIAIFAIVPPASIALLLAMAGPAALWALLPGVLAALYYLVWMPRVSARHGAERMRVMGDITTAVDDYARGIRIHRLYGVQSGALAAYHDAAGRFTRGMVAWVGKVATPAAVAVALLQAAATFAIAYAVTGAHDAAALAAALFFSLAIVTPALRLGHGLDYVAAGRAAAGRLAALLQEPALPAGAAPLPEGAPELTVKDAVLAVDGRRLLDGLQHRFAPGTLTAVTGPSGAGKTTLLRVLAGLEPLDEGLFCWPAPISLRWAHRHASQPACSSPGRRRAARHGAREPGTVRARCLRRVHGRGVGAGTHRCVPGGGCHAAVRRRTPARRTGARIPGTGTGDPDR